MNTEHTELSSALAEYVITLYGESCPNGKFRIFNGFLELYPMKLYFMNKVTASKLKVLHKNVKRLF